ncbi:PNGase F N-terminal domain-containing protein [Elizabethkingia anophelis]|uniref:PNGase F N-terminal domain-containing protein n=1 Tax=Elizabethkingia anophelis TaxID=1117645 RepID=UPI0021A46D79|nr:PNGase F N-terminal domain-containing protein [Elizabethkingia anophelis]MCT3904888.1 peptide-N-glycosidase [Elizabethkingia anophelis]CAH1137476.1 hypothetical protein EAVVTKC53_03663 [Elizabethkingia anophelis]CAI9684840.1 hypothetical protein EAVVTKC53_02831 [Elizabethkingia anophelis]
MQKILLCCLITGAQMIFAQTYEITYQNSFEGKINPNQNHIISITNSDKTLLFNEKIKNKKADFPFEVNEINRKNNEVSQFAFLNNNEIVKTSDNTILAKQEFKPTSETGKILGYNVKKAVTSVNSNTIEVWYTNDLKVKGGPSILGQDLGLVLKTVRNGSSVVEATSVKKIKTLDDQSLFNGKNITEKDALNYKDMIWKSRFITIPVFENETINFSDASKSDQVIQRFGNGTIILKKVKIPEIKQGNTIFVELKQKSNGDAYDRTGDVFIIPQERAISYYTGLTQGVKSLPVYQNGNGKSYQGVALTPDYLPFIELMRFFTPFGIGHFNEKIQLKGKNWHNNTPYRQDITELRPQLSGKEILIGAFIGNYDKGGHQISLELSIHPDQQKIVNNNFVLPVFNTTNVMEMDGQDYPTMFNSDKGVEVEFTLTKDLKNAQLRYITTGHGGWGAGDEFVPKENSIYLDGKLAHAFTPWRTDCGSYRLFNPASGNFEDGLSSSDLSRSNWCPGTITNPVYINLGNLNAGKHTIQVKIPQGAPEGSSKSFWNVSGVLLGQE